MASERPFYGSFAWAYDLLIERCVAPECNGIVGTLSRRGVPPSARILDAGCGTGQYARELARRGYVVVGIDRSPDMVAEARKSTAGGSAEVSFAVGDILALPGSPQFAAILCRGVLNDLLDPKDRQEVFLGFARALRPAGVLLFDVREWDASAARKAREPIFERTVDTPRGRLSFRSVTRLDPHNHQLLVSERHTLTTDGRETAADYEFVIKCWTREEVQECLRRVGFHSVQIFDGYDPSTPVGAPDRLVVSASWA